MFQPIPAETSWYHHGFPSQHPGVCRYVQVMFDPKSSMDGIAPVNHRHYLEREVSNWLVNGLFHLLLNAVYWGYNPLILTFDPNFQRDILVPWKPFLGHPGWVPLSRQKPHPDLGYRSKSSDWHWNTRGLGGSVRGWVIPPIYMGVSQK